MRLVVLDTETTGLEVAKNHRIVEIGCIELIAGRRTTNTYQTYINPNRPLSAEIVKLLGHDEEFYRTYPRFENIVQEFLDFVGEDTFVIHNAPFDMGFLNAELARLKKPPLKNKVIDSLLLARKKFPQQPNSLDALCKRFKIDLSQRSNHGALLDAGLLAEVYIALTSANQTSFGLNEDKPKSEEEAPPSSPPTPTLKSKALKQAPLNANRLTLTEKEAHQKLLGTIKNPLWSEFSAINKVV
jgi:DNA polymerase-3 subunit epsilon